MPGPQEKEYMREFLVDLGALPSRDRYLAAFSSLERNCLASIDDPETRRRSGFISPGATSATLAVRAEAAPRPAGPSTAPETPSTERALPALHSGRGHRLTELAQDEGDAFFAEASNPAIFGDFLAFAMRRRRCRPVRVLQRRQVLSSGAPLSRPQEIVRRLLHDEDLPLADRVAGVLVVLFVSR